MYIVLTLVNYMNLFKDFFLNLYQRMSFTIYTYRTCISGIINGCLTEYIYVLKCYMINSVNFFTSRRDNNIYIGVHDESTYISSPIH